MSHVIDRTEKQVAATEPPGGLGRRSGRRRQRAQDAAVRAGASWALLAWALTLLFFIPVAWMVLTSLHKEADAATNPPSILAPVSLDNYAALFDRGVGSFLVNSATASIVSTLIVLLLAIPAAYALSIRPVEKWTDVMFFFLSTKFLPPSPRCCRST